ncbi:LysR substrate-binding domain-containing protein [Pseudomonas luteola]|uniref:LysR substrate-binding domain-containing protein n=1 Tax=Pseudomonas luteola TaxID=47886 RepID=UPI001239B01E|nr:MULTISPECIES: LysR substrate-binding domain-containing protein [Pseudomonas]MBA1246186.1 LysR family transcriptional regulator [Pseudomonas zeshuii]QEU26894.1 LysR family transcriptional regulator [Pseudomonas luteola]
MDLRQLRSFVVLAQTLDFGIAAQQLSITKPPLSRQIATLEESLGTPLFIRNFRSLALTPAGKSFFASTTRLLADIDAAIQKAQATALGERGELRISFTMYSAWYVLPELVAVFAKLRPDIAIILDETLPNNMYQALITGDVDIGISFPLQLTHSLCYKILYREPLCAVLPNHHSLASELRISVGDLASDHFVAFTNSTAPRLHETVSACCRQYNFEPLIKVEAHLQQNIIDLVAKGIGVALVPDSMRKIKVPGAVFLPLIESPVIEQGIYWNPKNKNPCLPHLISYLSGIHKN